MGNAKSSTLFIFALASAAAFSVGGPKLSLQRAALRMSSTDTSKDVSAQFAREADDDLPPLDFDALSSESAAQAFKTSIDISDMVIKDESKRKAPRQAQWFPMLLSPGPLDGSLAGDVGFDPLGLAKDTPTLMYLREAEIKHARLAMLAAAGWPLEELWHRNLAELFGLESILAEANKAPSILNGGLDNTWIIGAGIASVVLGGVLELATNQAKKKDGYMPGQIGFDPLRLHSFRVTFLIDRIDERLTREEKIARGKFDMELCEIKNGRLAMLAITAYAAQEKISGMPIVEQSAWFFGDPLI